MDITSLTVAEASGLIRNCELTSSELTSACLIRIKKLESKIKPFITLTEDRALEAARIADTEIKSNRYRGPLHGIPIALKDLFETEGIRTTAGSKLSDHISSQNAFVVQKLIDAGAILLGKLHLHEWAFGATSVNPHFGTLVNPWNENCIPGGSSGGSAVALASRMCSAALGSDTGGSIRIPSALCGTVGLKPTFGLLSLRGVNPVSWSLDHVGPMARSVLDVATVLDAIACYDEYDPCSIPHEQEAYSAWLDEEIEGLQFFVPSNHFFDSIDSEVDMKVRQAIRIFERLGGAIIEGKYDGVEDDYRAWSTIIASEAAAIHRDHVRAHRDAIGADVLARLTRGESMTAIDFALANRRRRLSQISQTKFFQKFDVIVTPTTPIAAPFRVGLDAVETAHQLTRLTAPFNLIGFPAISVPCGFTTAGLPIGLQLAAGPWKERTLLRAAHAFESVTNWSKTQPPA